MRLKRDISMKVLHIDNNCLPAMKGKNNQKVVTKAVKHAYNNLNKQVVESNYFTEAVKISDGILMTVKDKFNNKLIEIKLSSKKMNEVFCKAFKNL